MPEGLKKFTDEEFVDLIAFLSSRKSAWAVIIFLIRAGAGVRLASNGGRPVLRVGAIACDQQHAGRGRGWRTSVR